MTNRTSWFGPKAATRELPRLLVERNRKIGYANAAAHALLGVEAGKLVGLPMGRLVSPERHGELKNVEQVFAGGAERKVRTVVRREDGQRFTTTIVIEPCRDGLGRVMAVEIRYQDPAGEQRMSEGVGHLTPEPVQQPARPSGFRSAPRSPAARLLDSSSRDRARATLAEARSRLSALREDCARDVTDSDPAATKRLRAVSDIVALLEACDRELAGAPQVERIDPLVLPRTGED